MRRTVYSVRLDRRAEREFVDLPTDVRRRFYRVFVELQADPYRPRSGCDIRALRGQKGARAVRVGAYRGIYQVIGTEVWFTVFEHRSTVYDR